MISVFDTYHPLTLKLLLVLKQEEQDQISTIQNVLNNFFNKCMANSQNKLKLNFNREVVIRIIKSTHDEI
jgi:hypothetical protein